MLTERFVERNWGRKLLLNTGKMIIFILNQTQELGNEYNLNNFCASFCLQVVVGYPT